MSDDTYTQRETVEIQRLIEETRKFTAEQRKLIAEAGKMRVERWLTPMLVVFGAIGSLVASWSAISALLHIAGIDR
jgi:hypothetical protein